MSVSDMLRDFQPQDRLVDVSLESILGDLLFLDGPMRPVMTALRKMLSAYVWNLFPDVIAPTHGPIECFALPMFMCVMELDMMANCCV